MFGRNNNKGFDLQGVYEGHLRVSYKGIPAIKCPFDYVLYQMIVFELKPDIIIEIGTNKGGSALYLADLLDANNKGIVHTIDLPENKEESVVNDHPRIKLFRQGFIAYDTSGLSSYDTVLVIEDGSHQYSDSLQALKKFSPYVTPGSYYIVEDAVVKALGREKEFNGGPGRAINEFLQQHKNFEVDRKWCDFFGKNATFNTDGFLKRMY